MRKIVYLSSLSIGRCFTLVTPPGEAESESKGATVSRSLLSPQDAWKVKEETDVGFLAVNAQGEEQEFTGEIKVVEIPREGYEKLASRK